MRLDVKVFTRPREDRVECIVGGELHRSLDTTLRMSTADGDDLYFGRCEKCRKPVIAAEGLTEGYWAEYRMVLAEEP